MLTTECIFWINNDNERYQVIYHTGKGSTVIHKTIGKYPNVHQQKVLEAQFVCDDRKAAELIVQVYCQQKNSNGQR